ncbi:MAG: 4-diphosphocytidyl-2-C-methyl-D-erythritol kinase [Sphingomonadales bacterium]|jgi:4-diphosphocytidyl-2-C-methyl-D-erythritol kinase|nr:4-diphosphocytidyl-2-C-methyl-D-erythritol kinase [Sphingomonadales bacterium]
MRDTARAKVNLALHVLGRRADGYHELDTLFAFAESGDLLEAEAAEVLSFEVTGPFAKGLAPDRDNLVLRAARALKERYAVDNAAALRLDKRLPVAAGLGGGSADAAAGLRLLVRLWGIDAPDADLLDLAARLGADVPACFLSRTVRGQGRGDRLTPAARSVTGTPILLVNPGAALATADVFRRWSGPGSGPLPDDPLAGRNDLEPAAIALAPIVGEALDRLRAAPGVTLARMSGSGATCFGLFGSGAERDSAAAAIRAERPAWWQLASCLV